MRTKHILQVHVLGWSLLIAAALNAENPSFARVNAPSGLRMRTAASTDGNVILTIPNGAEVQILQIADPAVEISGKSGKWTRVKYQKADGWVFGGFLAQQVKVDFGSVEKSGAEFKIPDPSDSQFTLSLKPNGTFSGYCSDGHYGGGSLSGAWRLDGNDILLDGTASLEWNSAGGQRHETVRFNDAIEIRSHGAKLQIFTYKSKKYPSEPNMTPCQSRIVRGKWISSQGVEKAYFE